LCARRITQSRTGDASLLSAAVQALSLGHEFVVERHCRAHLSAFASRDRPP
jgi:hypothetical protein